MESDLIAIVKELNQKLCKIDESVLDEVAKKIVNANRVYAYGCGRSGLSLRTFAMRIMHLGKECYFIHDTCVPPIRENDLLIVASGSGNTESTVAVAKRANNLNVEIILLSSNKESIIAKMATSVIYIPLEEYESIQYQGNCYDEAQFIIQDVIIYKTRKLLNLTRDEMNSFHTNIE